MDQGKVTLDDRVADDVSLTGQLRCSITLSRPDEAFARAIAEWGFEPGIAPGEWTGRVAGPDRLRFLGVLSRYAGLISAIRLDEAPAPPRLAEHG
jgi:ABC-2 type transport system ATP-binding protein